jgi:transcriptional regulator with XRE-family HTH domain
MAALESVAVNLQTWRQRRGMSVSALARAAGVSKSTVSELERHNSNPSLDTLWALARALNIPLGFLFSDHEGAAATRVIRSDDPSAVTLEQPGYTARLMGGFSGEGELELYLLRIRKGVKRESASHGFGVVEHAMPLTGRVDIGIAGDSAILEPGDLITFRADQPHHYEALDGPAMVISIHQYPKGRPDANANGSGEDEEHDLDGA